MVKRGICVTNAGAVVTRAGPAQGRAQLLPLGQMAARVAGVGLGRVEVVTALVPMVSQVLLAVATAGGLGVMILPRQRRLRER